MVKVPKKILLTEQLIEDKKIYQDFRTYLGASQIGKECVRAVWYQFRHYKDISFEPRLIRLFNRGHREEKIILKDLKKQAGIKVLATQEGAKFANGHGGGHHDGRLINVPDAPKTQHLLECKTMNERNFQEVKKHGVEKSHFVYFVQMQIYMKLFKLKRALFIAVNKNTDERYYERIKFDNSFALKQIKKAKWVINQRTPPEKIEDGSAFYTCMYCYYSKICSNIEKPRKGCRTCKYSKPIDKGKWYCEKTKKKLKFKKQLKGCKNWKKIRNNKFLSW